MIKDGRYIVLIFCILIGILLLPKKHCFAYESDSYDIPVDPSIRLKEKANYHLSLGEMKEAVMFLDSALQLTSSNDLKAELYLTKSSIDFIQFKLKSALTNVTLAESFIPADDYNRLKHTVFLKAGIYHYKGELHNLSAYTESSFSINKSNEAHSFNDKLIEHHNNNLLWHYGAFEPGIKFFKDHIDNDHILHLSEGSYFRYLGDLHLIRDEYSEALDYYSKISTEDEDFANMGFTYYTRMIETLLQLDDLEKVNEYLQKLKSDKSNVGNPYKGNYLDYISLAYQIKGEKNQNIVSACDSLLSATKSNGLLFLYHYYSLKFAELFFDHGQIEESNHFINLIPYAIEDGITDYKRKNVLYRIASANGNTRLATKLQEDINSSRKSLEIYSISKSKLESKIDLIYPLSKRNTFPTWVRFGLLSIPLVLLGFYLFQRYKQRKISDEKEKIRLEYEKLKSEFDHIGNIDAQNLKENDVNEIELKRLLAEKEEKINSFERSIELHSKDKLLKLAQYQDRIKDLEGKLGLLEKRTTGSLNKEIKQLIEKVDENSKQEDFYDEFVTQVESNHPSLVIALSRYSQLSEKQKVLCYSIKLDMNISETAQLMNISTHAIKKARNRIWKQMEFDSYDDFKLFIKSN